MFCYQCEQNSKGACNTNVGVCGKDEKTAIMQDILLFAAKGLAWCATELSTKGVQNKKYDIFVMEALFTTVTNVSFDYLRIVEQIKTGSELLEEAKAECLKVGLTIPKEENHPVNFKFVPNPDDLMLMAGLVALETRFEEEGKAYTGIVELIVYGLKGLAAYAHHAYVLGYEKQEIYARINATLHYILEKHTAEELLGKALETGELNMQVMELLDSANTTSYGHPEPSPVRITAKKGKAILVSGHDLKDLEELLKQTEGMGINIYTHGEMLPALGYPLLKKYSHLAGNYGGAWQDQWKEFAAFPGAVLMTTNCIQEPKESYHNRIFTCGLVSWPNVTHISDRNFKPVIDAALAATGFTEDEEEKNILTGFGHNAVLSVADKVVEAVKNGDIKHFYLIGGCDGAKSGRNYYTDFATQAPKDSIIMTLACGKFRFNKLEFGDINGIPRLLDIGQCNDAYSAIKIAVALAEVFETDVNSLPLSLILSWYEQKAVAILLTLLHLGIKNIKIGPTLPAFIEPEVLNILVETFQLKPITTVEADMAETLA